jgi:hypothetical protein
MLKAPATGTNLSFPNAQSVKDVLPQLTPLQLVTVSITRVSSSSQLCIAAHLIVCKKAIVAVTPLRFRKLSVMSFRASGALDLPGFCMMPGLRQTLPFRAGRL